MNQLHSIKKNNTSLSTFAIYVSVIALLIISCIGYQIHIQASSIEQSLEVQFIQVREKRQLAEAIKPVFNQTGFVSHLVINVNSNSLINDTLQQQMNDAQSALLTWQKTPGLAKSEANDLITIGRSLQVLRGALYSFGVPRTARFTPQLMTASKLADSKLAEITATLNQLTTTKISELRESKQLLSMFLLIALACLPFICFAIYRYALLLNLYRNTVTYISPAAYDMCLVFEYSPEATLVLDETGGIIYANQQACSMAHYARSQLLPMHIEQLVSAKDIPQIDVLLREKHGEGSSSATVEFLPLNHPPLLVKLKMVVREINGVSRTLVTFSSVDKQQKHIDKISQQTAMFDRAQNINHCGSWHWELATDKIIWSKELYNLLGVSPDEVDVSNDTLMSLIPSDQREDISNAINEALVFDKPLQVTHYITTGSGQKLLIKQKAVIERDATKKAITMTGCIKKIEVQVTTNHYQNVFENSRDAMLITDGRGTVQQVNSSYTSLTGFYSDYVVGKSITDISRADYLDQSIYKKIWTTLENDKKWEGELWNTKRDGVVYPTWQTISVLDDSDPLNILYLCAINDISEQKHVNELLSNHSIEQCTKLPSRNVLFDRISQAIKRHERDNKSTAVILLALDHEPEPSRKQLVAIASRLKDITRAQDSIARFGLHEFIIVLEGLTNPEDAYIVSDKIAKSFDLPFFQDAPLQHFRCNIGIAMHPLHSANDALLLNYADAAMQYAKANAESNIQVFNQKLLNDYNETKHLNNQLQRAIDLKELAVQFQPMVNLQDHSVSIAVAHIRWHHAAYNNNETYKFINAAKSGKLRGPLHYWLLENALAQATLWPNHDLASLKLQIKVVKEQLVKPGLCKSVTAMIELFHYDPKRLILELESSVLTTLDEVAQQEIKQLKAIGVAFNISSLENESLRTDQMQQLDIDTVTTAKKSLADTKIISPHIQVSDELINTIENHNIYAATKQWTQSACTITIGDIDSQDSNTFLVSDSIANDKLITLAHLLKSSAPSTQVNN